MSFSEKARFYKQGVFIVSGRCNIRWSIDSETISRYIFDAMEDALKEINHHFGIKLFENENRIRYYNKFKDKIFGKDISKQDFLEWDEVYLYDLLIPRKYVDDIHYKRITNEEFSKMIDEGRFKINKNVFGLYQHCGYKGLRMNLRKLYILPIGKIIYIYKVLIREFCDLIQFIFRERDRYDL